MKTKAIATILGVCFAGSAAAQTFPSFLKKTGSYNASVFGPGGGYGAGGIEFDATGTYLYIGDINTGNVVKVTVVRTGGKITGFTSPTTVMTTNFTGWIDAGLTISRIGTMFATGWTPYELEQIALTTSAQTISTVTGMTGTTGGCEFIPGATPATERFLMSDYTRGGIYEVPLTLQPNLTYKTGTPTLYMRTAGGIEGFALVPTGPFGKGRGLVYTDYDNGTLTLVALDPATRNPLTDQSGNIMTMPLMSGIPGPVDVEFDPLTGDMFVADYGTGATTTSVALLQFEGAIQGGFDGNFHKYGAGCPTKSAAIPTLTANTQLTAGVGITFIMSSAPLNQSTSFLVFGVGDTGNIGGFLFGGTTCRVYVNPMLSVPFATNSSGVASIAFTIPLAAKGVSVFAQAWALSPGANILNLTVSDAGCSFIK